MKNTEQMSVWSGEFGKAYTERNKFQSVEEFNALYVTRYGKTRDELNQLMLQMVPKNARILEVGANVGNQLAALQRLGYENLFGVELQRHCVEIAHQQFPSLNIVQGAAFDLPFRDGFFDLVFTNNVLIHISPEDIGEAMSEMYRVTRRWIWGFEYFAPKFTEIPYRGKTNLLWKADYAREFASRLPGLVAVDERLFECLDEPGNQDKMYMLEKRG